MTTLRPFEIDRLYADLSGRGLSPRTDLPTLIRQLWPALSRLNPMEEPCQSQAAAARRGYVAFEFMQLRSFGVVITLALLAACGGKDPVGDLHSASAATDGRTVWVVGGTVVSDAVWNQMTTPSFELPPKSKEAVVTGANDHAVQYDLEGHVLQDVGLGHVDLGMFPSLGGLTAGSASGGTVLAGTACIQKSSELTDGCTLTPVALAVHGGRVERVNFDEDYAGAEDVRVVGVLGSEVLVAIATQAGAALGSPNEVDLFAIDPSQSGARRISLPPGVMFARALCLRGSEIVALTIDLDDPATGRLGTLQVGVIDSSGALGAPVSIPLSQHFPGAAAIVCRDDVVTVLELPPADSFSSETSLLLHDVDLAMGTVTASSELPLTYTAVPSLESIAGDLLLIDGYSSGEARPARWSGGAVGPAGKASRMYGGNVVVVDDQLLDVRGLLAQVPGGDAPAPIELPVPSVP